MGAVARELRHYRQIPVNISADDLAYATSLEEVSWGLVLIGITMILHGLGMLVATITGNRVSLQLERYESFFLGLIPVVVASWIIVLVHLVEAMVWAGFFL